MKDIDQSETWTCVCGWKNHPKNMICGGNVPTGFVRRYGCGTDKNQSQVCRFQIKSNHEREEKMKKRIKELEGLCQKHALNAVDVAKNMNKKIQDLEALCDKRKYRIEELEESCETLTDRYQLVTDQIRQERNYFRNTEKELQDVQNRYHKIRRELQEKDETCTKWVERTIKLNFIFDQQKKIGALPSDHAEWVYPMVTDIISPDPEGPSILNEVDRETLRLSLIHI